jgi:hypothetical protein
VEAYNSKIVADSSQKLIINASIYKLVFNHFRGSNSSQAIKNYSIKV